MEVQHKTEKQKGLFSIEEDQQFVAELAYSLQADDHLVIHHTEVNSEYRGQDIGEQLVYKAVDYARENNYKIIPTCPFARAIIEKDENLKDVLG